jgi:hypothetical protein
MELYRNQTVFVPTEAYIIWELHFLVTCVSVAIRRLCTIAQLWWNSVVALMLFPYAIFNQLISHMNKFRCVCGHVQANPGRWEKTGCRISCCCSPTATWTLQRSQDWFAAQWKIPKMYLFQGIASIHCDSLIDKYIKFPQILFSHPILCVRFLC